MDRPRDGTTLCLFCALEPRQRRLLSTALMNSMHLCRPNVYQTLVLVWRHSRVGLNLLLAIDDAASEETSINTFVQLASLYFSGLVAIVRSQEARLSRLQESRRAMNERRPVPLYEWNNRQSRANADLMVLAERELGAFIGAVTELFGPAQAKLAADVWLDELELMDALPGPTRRDWGSVTIAASAQLTRRFEDRRGAPNARHSVDGYQSLADTFV